MTLLLIILLIIACVVLSFFVLIQKPKGGGLSGSFGSLGTQVMGVKQSTDVMEKGTWYTMTAIAVISILIAFTMDFQKPILPTDGEPTVPTTENTTTNPNQE